jgi:prevent-host-death family protein
MSSKGPKSGVLPVAGPAHESLSATEAQNNFGQVLGRAKRGGRVFITRYDRPEAVLLSIEEYEALTGREPVDPSGPRARV